MHSRLSHLARNQAHLLWLSCFTTSSDSHSLWLPVARWRALQCNLQSSLIRKLRINSPAVGSRACESIQGRYLASFLQLQNKLQLAFYYRLASPAQQALSYH